MLLLFSVRKYKYFLEEQNFLMENYFFLNSLGFIDDYP